MNEYRPEASASLRILLTVGALALAAPAPLAGQHAQALEPAAPATLAGRSTVYAPRGAIATSQPLATSAGLAVLERGGNAIDAAITAAAVLAIVEPHMTGIGGDMFALVWSARERRLIGLSGHGRSGSDMTREAILARGHERVPPFGAESVTVPGTVRGWADLLERFGTITLAEALAPAIRLADEGFPLSPVIARQWAESAERLQRDEGARAAYLVDGHRAPAAGEWFRNPDYAASLRAIAEGGADAFYDGPLGRRLVDGLRARGGFLTHDDLRAHRSQWVEPISAEFRGHRVWQIPPPGQGIAALQMLRILEPFDLAAMGHNTPEYLHHLIEAKRLAYADLDRFVADPRHMAVTPERLLADDYIARRRALIRAERAMTEIEPDPALTAGETIYLAAADAEGNMVSFINSLAGAFGSGIVVPGTGFALQNRGANFSMEEGHANLVAPGKSPFHTIIPGFVTRRNAAGEEEPWLAYGVMGGLIQPQAHAQLLLNLIVFGMDPQEAIDAPRFAHVSELRVWLERPFGEEVRAALGAKGHEVGELPVRFAGGAQLVMRLERGWAAASEPRRDGHAAGH